MDCEDVQSIVNTEPELQLGGKVAGDSTDNAENDGAPWGDKARGWRDSNETGDSTTAETNSAPLLLQTVIQQAPGESAHTSSNVSNNAGHHGTQVCTESTAAVEAEPTNPEEDCTEHDVSDIMRAVWKAVNLVVSCALAEHQGVGESGSAGGNVDGRTAGKVEATELEGPAVGIPRPVGNRIVDNC